MLIESIWLNSTFVDSLGKKTSYNDSLGVCGICVMASSASQSRSSFPPYPGATVIRIFVKCIPLCAIHGHISGHLILTGASGDTHWHSQHKKTPSGCRCVTRNFYYCILNILFFILLKILPRSSWFYYCRKHFRRAASSHVDDAVAYRGPRTKNPSR